MINNYSVVDGIRVILGNVIMQFAGLIVLIALARPPDYADEDTQYDSKLLFGELVVAHVCFAVSNYLYIDHYNWSILSSVLCIFWAIIIMTQIFHNWFFTDVVLDAMTDEQRRFRFMMIIELLTMIAHIVSTLVYMFICLINKPILQLASSNFADERRDFL